MELSVIQIQKVVQEGISQGASDLHLFIGGKPELRVNGVLTTLDSFAVVTKEDMLEMLGQIVTEEQYNVFKENKELDLAKNFLDNVRTRINIYYAGGYPNIAMRFLPVQIKTIEDLHLPSIIHSFSQITQGFVLVTGSTGAGKSTTLASIIEEINVKSRKKIITIEDPVEFIYTPKQSIISQREFGRDTKSFDKALISSLREDADIVLVGEMRDYETIKAAVTAAETGHVIFSTLHTNSAAQTIYRIVDTFPYAQQNQIRAQLALSLKGIIAQKLIPTIDGKLVPAVEVLLVNSAVKNLIRENKIYQIDTVLETHNKEGMITMTRSLHNLVKEGLVSFEVAMEHAPDPTLLESLMNRL